MRVRPILTIYILGPLFGQPGPLSSYPAYNGTITTETISRFGSAVVQKGLVIRTNRQSQFVDGE